MKKNWWYRGMIAVALAAALIAITACGKKQAEESAPQLTGTLKIWSWLTQTERAQELEKLGKAYEAARPGVTVEITVAPWQGALDKVVAAIMAGNPPDLAMAGNGYPQALAGTGGLMEVSSLLNELGGTDAFLAASLALGDAEDGGTYSIPLYVTPYVAYYRQSWLDAAGITKLPATWEEYYTMCKAVTNPAQNRYGFGMPLSDLHGWKTVWTLLQSNQVDLVNRDAGGKWYVDMNAEKRAAAAEVYQYLYRLIKDCSPAGAAGYNQQNVRELVAQGVIMSRIDTPEIYYNVRAMDPDHLNDVKFFPFPGRKTTGSGLGWVAWTIPVKGNTALASDFLKFIHEGERMIPFYNSYPYAMFPGKKDLFASAQYRDNLPEEIRPLVPDMALQILNRSTGVGMANGPFPNAGEIESHSVLNDPLNNMLIKGISAEQAVDQLVEALEALLR